MNKNFYINFRYVKKNNGISFLFLKKYFLLIIAKFYLFIYKIYFIYNNTIKIKNMDFFVVIGKKNIVDMAKNEGYNQVKKEKMGIFYIKI